MRHLRNQQGIALVMALMLTLISLVIVMAVLYMVTQGTKVSAGQKRYQNELEASYGGFDLYVKDFLPQALTSAFNNQLTSSALNSVVSSYAPNLRMSSQVSAACLGQKLLSPFGNWSSCGAGSKSGDPMVSPDLQFRLMGTVAGQGFKIYNKIIDTQAGNTNLSTSAASSGGLGFIVGGVVENPGGGDTTGGGRHYPYLYNIEVVGQNEAKPSERVHLSVLYAY